MNFGDTIRNCCNRRSPRPSIPPNAREKIVEKDARGVKKRSEFWSRGRLVGRAAWHFDDEWGCDVTAIGLRNGRAHGYQIDCRSGKLLYAEPFVDGLVHGWTKQYDEGGRLLIECPFKRGTGVDYWCDDAGELAEEHPMVDGKPSGWERWWSGRRSVYIETKWLRGEMHGISREWRDGKLERGYPRFFIRNARVSKRKYVAAARSDPTLPPYDPRDDRPARALPKQFLELRDRVKRRSRGLAR